MRWGRCAGLDAMGVGRREGQRGRDSALCGKRVREEVRQVRAQTIASSPSAIRPGLRRWYGAFNASVDSALTICCCVAGCLSAMTAPVMPLCVARMVMARDWERDVKVVARLSSAAAM